MDLTEINETETNNQNHSKKEGWFFEKMLKIDKPLPKLTEKWRVTVQIGKIRHENEDIPTDTR